MTGSATSERATVNEGDLVIEHHADPGTSGVRRAAHKRQTSGDNIRYIVPAKATDRIIDAFKDAVRYDNLMDFSDHPGDRSETEDFGQMYVFAYDLHEGGVIGEAAAYPSLAMVDLFERTADEPGLREHRYPLYRVIFGFDHPELDR